MKNSLSGFSSRVLVMTAPSLCPMIPAGSLTVDAPSDPCANITSGHSGSLRGQLGRTILELGLIQPRVRPTARQQLRMRAALDDAALLQHQDQIGGQDGREAVRDGERGPADHQLG